LKITFPHLGNVYIAGKVFLEELGHEVIPAPICSKRTIEIGSKYSPESMCMPFKVFIGNYIESIEMGADTILITGSCGPCRFGLYSLLQEDILKKLNYDVEFIVLDSVGEGFKDLTNNVKKLLGTNSYREIIKSGNMALKLIKSTDELSQLSNEIRSYAINKNQVDSIMNTFYNEAVKVDGGNNLLHLISGVEQQLRNVPQLENYNPIRIGIVGEIYTIIEPFVNLEIEKKLGHLGVLVDKSLTPTKWFEHHVISYPFGSAHENNKFRLAKPYLENKVGGHGVETIGSVIDYKNLGYDGVIQILPLNCMPEIVAKNILKNVERDIDMPIMTLIVDELTGEAGYMTRLEAFVDLLSKRREKYRFG